jgi:hypothetical protein
MSNWELGGRRIFVTDIGSDFKQIIARLHPLGGGTVHHTFGYEDAVRKLKCYVVGSTDMGQIESFTASGTTFVLGSPYGALGNYFVSNVNHNMLNTVCQTLRPDLPDNSPVYVVDIELYQEI